MVVVLSVRVMVGQKVAKPRFHEVEWCLEDHLVEMDRLQAWSFEELDELWIWVTG